MTDDLAAPAVPLGGGVATTALFGVTAGFLGLLTGLPYLLGPVVGGAGVVLASVARTRRPTAGNWRSWVPALAALGVLSATAPVAPAAELFAGLAGLAFLLWAADDPGRTAGGGRRALPMIAPAALGVGLVWVLTLALTGRAASVGLAAALLVAALVVLAVLVASLSVPPPELDTPGVEL